MTKRATLIQIAEAAGVSISTVDRVINGRGGVRADKERLVLEWASKLHLGRILDYRPHRTMRIGVLMQDPSNPFYEGLRTAVGRANRLFAHLNAQCFVHYFEIPAPARMAALITTTAASHEGLIVIAYDHPLINEALRAASARLPIITIVSDLPRSGRRNYIGLDNLSAGRVAGELIARFLGPAGGDLILLSGMRSFVGHGERETGFRAVLAERFPNCRVATVLEAREQVDSAGDIAYAALAENPAIRGIYNISTGDLAIAATLQRIGVSDHIVFVTHELTPERRRLLREGVFDAVIDQNPEIEMTTAVETMLHYLGRIETPPQRTITPFYIYVRENA